MVRSSRTWLIAGLGVLLVLALLLPDQAVLFAGAAAGWALAVLVVFRNREQMNYQQVIRLMHRGEYEQAIGVMDGLIDAEPDAVKHRSFRANLHMLNGDLDRAAADYHWISERDAAGYIGLAEIAMQQGDYDRARQHASAALKRDPDGWPAAYNLGWIADRQAQAADAIKYLDMALENGLPAVFQLLARLWLARSYHRLGRDSDAEQQLALLRREKKNVREWQLILESEQGVVLRDLLEQDVRLAQQLIETDAPLEIFDT